tara:strand:+ start:442 stop:1296 length:855 start_codon:yes stop_codon:yes gene_type:complete
MKQIQTQNQKNLSKINFGISKKEEIKDSIRNLEKIRHLDNEEPIKQALRYIFALIGLKADQIPGDVEKIVLINFIKDNYQNNCPSELKIAFELAIKGEFEADLNHYGSFSALYLSKIFNNYLDYRRNIVLEMQREEEEIQKKKREEYENRPEVIEKRKKDFDKNVLLALFNAYKEDGILDTGLIPCSIVYKSLKERHGLFDLSQEEKQKILNEAKRATEREVNHRLTRYGSRQDDDFRRLVKNALKFEETKKQMKTKKVHFIAIKYLFDSIIKEKKDFKKLLNL